jgi:Protein of unknown function (DUF4199)
MRKIVGTYGLIAGAILSAMMLGTLPFMDRIGFDRGMIIGYTSMVMAFLMVYYGTRSYRDQVLGGDVTFGGALRVGLLIVLVATVCYVITWELIYYQIAPDFADKYAAFAVEKARASGAPESEIAATAAQMAEFKEMYRNPLVNIAFTTMEPLPIGLLSALLSAALLRRPRRQGATVRA